MLFALILLFSNPVMANEVVLKPGGQVLVRAGQDMQVSCTGAPRCIVYNRTPSEGNLATHLVVAGNNHLREYADSLDEALDLVERLRKAGLCQ